MKEGYWGPQEDPYPGSDAHRRKCDAHDAMDEEFDEFMPKTRKTWCIGYALFDAAYEAPSEEALTALRSFASMLGDISAQCKEREELIYALHSAVDRGHKAAMVEKALDEQ